MATIGLYDMDFLHGSQFNLSLPLMHAYAKLMDEGHQVIMMKAYEKTGRYNKIFYFKDNPSLKLPNKLVIDTQKGKFIGYGFYGKVDLKEETKEFPPSFAPYDLMSNLVKNKNLYKSIKTNSLIDWREKDFTMVQTGAAITYVNDRDFLNEEDWEEVFDHFDNNIDFVHIIKTELYDDTRVKKFLEKSYGTNTTILLPADVSKDYVQFYNQYRGVEFDMKGKDADSVFIHIFASKIYNEKIRIQGFYPTDEFGKAILRWNRTGGRSSFKDFMGKDWEESFRTNSRYSGLLIQNPTKITYDEFVEDYLVK